MKTNEQWLNWAVEIQSIAQCGLAYAKDIYDIERYEQLRNISAEMISYKTAISAEKVKSIFCNEEGYQTPKLDTRAAIFKNDKILLVQEKNLKWSMPGGWVDVNQTIKTNTEKEVKEEAGLDATAVRIIALQDRNKHNYPIYAHNICKVFVLCTVDGGHFRENSETVNSSYFSMYELPELSVDKTTKEQIEMCFDAYKNENKTVQFD